VQDDAGVRLSDGATALAAIEDELQATRSQLGEGAKVAARSSMMSSALEAKEVEIARQAREIADLKKALGDATDQLAAEVEAREAEMAEMAEMKSQVAQVSELQVQLDTLRSELADAEQATRSKVREVAVTAARMAEVSAVCATKELQAQRLASEVGELQGALANAEARHEAEVEARTLVLADLAEAEAAAAKHARALEEVSEGKAAC